MAILPAVEIEPKQTATASVIWLHGLGADGHDFESIVPELNIPTSLAVRFIFPHAPIRPVTINGGLPMRAWFDVTGLDRNLALDEAGIRQSAITIEQLIKRENERGIANNRIILAGFSQGGAMALHCGLRQPESLAGLIILSAFLPLAEKVSIEAHHANQKTPIFMAHGTQDPLIPVDLSQLGKDYLIQQGYSVQWHTYPMPHSVCAQEITAIGQWLTQVLK